MIEVNLHFNFCILQTIIFVQQTSSFINMQINIRKITESHRLSVSK